MKILFFILLFIFEFAFASAQKSDSTFVNELTISLNRSNVKDNNTSNRNGFGLGIIHSERKNKILSIVIGAELFYGAQLKKSGDESQFSNITDLTYHFYNASIRLMPRFQFGVNTKLIIEFGPVLDIPIYGYAEGTYSNFNTSNYQYTTQTLRYKTEYPINLNMCVGAGFSHKFGKVELYLKPEYKIAKTIDLDNDHLKRRYLLLTMGFR